MAINCPRQLIFVLVSLLLSGGSDWLAAQPPPAAAQYSAVGHLAEERERSKTLPRDFSWSPDGKSIGFIQTVPSIGKTARSPQAAEIWSVDPATGLKKILVSNTEIIAAFGGEVPRAMLGGDNEEETRRSQLQEYLWDPGGHALLLATNTKLTWFDLDTHSSRPIATVHAGIGNPQISPDGRFVSYLAEHTLWLADAATGAAHAFTPAGNSDLRRGEPDWVYSHELELQSAYWWSPDSSFIAWMETDDRAVDHYSLRNSDGDENLIAYPKPGGTIPAIRLFVQPISGGKPLQIDLGGEANAYIPLVQWLPDGKQLAIERLSRDQKTLDLLLADAETGKTRTILTDKDVYWINMNRDLHFLKDSRRFLWSSQRSGYRHLYLYDISGRQLIQLTKGNWEVTKLAGVDENLGLAYLAATEASPIERQLYRVNLDGSGFTRVTQEKGTHEAALSPAGGIFLDTWSNHASPPRQDLLRTDGTRITTLSDKLSEDPAVNQLGKIEFLTVRTHMGMDLNAWVMKPLNFNPARQYPVLLYVAGGPGEQIVRDAWGGDISLWFALMAQNGYIVFAIGNRGTAGRGHFFEEPVHLRFSATEMADLRDGVLYLRSQPWIDKTRIGICGWGYGGFLALHGMLDRPLLFKAGFAGSPITDWHLVDAVFTERYLENPVRNQDGWLSSSPLENAKYLHAPLLLAQATLDESVHQENALKLLDELLDKGKYADILLFPDRRDLFDDYGARYTLFQRLTDFFVKNL